MNHVIRRAFVTVTIAAATLAPLTACDINGNPITGSSTSDVAALTPAEKDGLFIATLNRQGFPLDGADDAAIDTAHTMCDTLDAGVPASKIAGVIIKTYGASDAGTFVGAASATYCPEYTDDFMSIGTGAA